MYSGLSAMQIARLESVGRRRKVDRGEIIVEQGAVPSAFFVVIAANSQSSSRRTEESCLSLPSAKGSSPGRSA